MSARTRFHHFLHTPALIACAALTVMLGIQTWRLDRSQLATTRALLEATNATARADSTRNVTPDNWAAGRVIVERLLVQERQRADALDRALKLVRVVNLRQTLVIDSLSAVIPGQPVTESAEGVREGRFSYRQIPYSASAIVRLPPAPEAGLLDLTVALDPVPLKVRLGCRSVRGRAPFAVAVVEGPDWARIQLDSVSQSPAICQPPAPKRTARTLAVGAGVGLLGALLLR